MKTYRLKIKPGADIKKTIQEFAKETSSNGFLLGVVGDLSKAVFQCPKKRDVTSLTGILEIITLNGTISEDNVHLHLSLSDSDCNVWGGHLEHGTIVLKGADVLIGVLNKDSNSTSIDIGGGELNEGNILEIATLPNCPWSNRILKMLSSSKVTHKVIVVEDDMIFEKVKCKSNSSIFPQIFYDNKYIGGYDKFVKLFKEGRFN